MADNTIDTLEIQVESNARLANDSLNSLVSTLQKVSKKVIGVDSALAGMGGNGLSSLASGVAQLTHAMSAFKGGEIKTADFTRIATGLNKLGTVNVQGVSDASRIISTLASNLSQVGMIKFDSAGIANIANAIANLGRKTVTQATTNIPALTQSLSGLVTGLNSIGKVNFDVTNLANLVSSITKLGGKTATNAIPNIDNLTSALSRMMTVLSKAPNVSQNIIQMTNAMAKLAGSGSKVGTASRGIVGSFNAFGNSATKAGKKSWSLAAKIGRLYATFWVLQRGVKAAMKSVESSMDFIEAFNYFDVALAKIGQDAEGAWQKNGYSSAQAYADSFKDRLLQLNKTMTGYEIDDNGYATYTNTPNLGMNPQDILNYSAMYAQMADSMGLVGETSIRVSKALTMLGADWASLRNISLDTAWEKFASALAGQTRAVRSLGIDITQATLQETAYKYGLDQAVQSMDQATKTQLRLLTILDQSKVAFGDMARTIESPANQLRVFQQNIANLGRTIGNLFLPIVSKVLPYVNGLIIALQRLFALLGLKIGIKESIGDIGSSIGSASGGMVDFAEDTEEASDALGDAAKNAKKLKNATLGIDELNIIQKQEESGGGNKKPSGGGGSGLLDDAIADALADYESIWDKLLKNTKAQEIADKIFDFFMKVADAAQPTIDALNRLWRDGLSKLSEFTWTALKDFYYDFLRPISNWTLGTGLPMLIDALNDFLTAIHWTEINDALRNFWRALEPFAEAVGVGLIRFFKDLLQVGAGFINKVVPDGLNSIAKILNDIPYKKAEKIGYGLGILATSLFAFKGVKSIANGIGDLSKNFGKFFKVSGAVKYTAIAIGIGAVIVALDEFGYIDVNWKTISSALSKLFDVLKKYTVGIGKGIISFIDGLASVASPIIEVAVNGIAKALEIFANILDKIPENVIAGITQTFLSFFAAWKTYQGINVVMETVSKALGPVTSVFGKFNTALINISSNIGVLDSFKSAFGTGGLGGIKFMLIAGGIGALTMAFKAYYDEIQKPSPDMQKWINEFDSVLESSKQTTEGIRRDIELWQKDFSTAMQGGTEYGEKLAQKYNTLAEKENKSALETAKMKQYAQELVEIYPELNGHIDEETGLLDLNAESIQKVIDKQKELNRYKALQELAGEAFQTQFEAEIQYNIDEKSYNEAKQKSEELYKKAQEYAQKYNYKVEQGTGYGATNITADKGFDWGYYKDLNNNITSIGKELSAAEEQLAKSRQVLTDATNSYTESQTAADEAMESMLLKSPEMQESINSIKTSFDDLGTTITDGFATKLAMSGEAGIAGIQTLFGNIKSGVEVSGEEMKTAFSKVGIGIPQAFTTAIAQEEPEMQMKLLNMFASLNSGAKLSAEELKDTFDLVGLELPDGIIKGLAYQESAVQQSTVSMLGNIESGQKLYESSLKQLFYNLGIEVPNQLVSALDGKNADLQEATIRLLAKIQAGEEISAGNITSIFTDLGYEIPDAIINSLAGRNSDVLAGVMAMLAQMSDGVALTKKELILLYGQLGLDVPDAMITSISGKGADAQAQVTNLLSQFGAATDSEKGKLIDKMKELGIDTVEGYNGGISENTDSTKKEMLKWMADNVNSIHDSDMNFGSPSITAWNFGKDTVEGFNLGIRGHKSTTITEIQTWMQSVKDAFSLDQWTTTFSNILPAFQAAWTTVTEWWNTTAIPEFWASNMETTFTIENWLLLFNNILLALQQNWLEITTWWGETALPKWWKEGVVPWFTLERWFKMLEPVRLAFEKKWIEIFKLLEKKHTEINEMMVLKEEIMETGWDETLDGMVETTSHAFEDIKNIANEAIDSIISKIEELNSAIAGIGSGLNAAASVSFGLSARGYASGGFPQMGDLFLANERGPELVGTFGGRTAVANNDMITRGISDAVGPAVYDAVVSAFSSMGGENNNNIYVTVELDGREIVAATDIRRERSGFDFSKGITGNGRIV